MELLNRTWLSKIALCTLTIHTSIAALVMRRSRDVPPEEHYISATSVLLGEILKIFISIYLHDAYLTSQYHEDMIEKAEIPKEVYKNTFYHRFYFNAKNIYVNASWQMSIPASLYVLQNCLQLHSISLITVVEYQALSQLKIVAIGVFSTLILRRKLYTNHWLSMCSLLMGVTLLQCGGAIQSISFRSISSESLSIFADQVIELRNRFWASQIDGSSGPRLIGVASVIMGCILGSYAGVFMEKAFKNDRQGLWSNNAQLSFFSLLPASLLLVTDLIKHNDINILRGFGFWAWLTVIIRGLGGIIVAVVLKYCDNILKAFATSAAIVLSMIISSLWYDELPDSSTIIGAIIVICSSISYARTDTSQRKL